METKDKLIGTAMILAGIACIVLGVAFLVRNNNINNNSVNNNNNNNGIYSEQVPDNIYKE